MTDIAARIRTDLNCYDLDAAGQIDHLTGAIRALLNLHMPAPWYEECFHAVPEDDDPSHDEFWDNHNYYGPDSDILSCEEARSEDRCSGCTPDGADDDTVMSVKHPCRNVLAIAEALGISNSPAGQAGSQPSTPAGEPTDWRDIAIRLASHRGRVLRDVDWGRLSTAQAEALRDAIEEREWINADRRAVDAADAAERGADG